MTHPVAVVLQSMVEKVVKIRQDVLFQEALLN